MIMFMIMSLVLRQLTTTYISSSAQQIIGVAFPTLNRTVTVRMISNPGKQLGAMVALSSNAATFHQYDWVVRVNPDVIVRNDQFLVDAFNDVGIDGAFVNCATRGPVRFHTDFFAFRPRAVHALDHAFDLVGYSELLCNRSNHRNTLTQCNAEWHLTNQSFPSIVKSKRYVLVPGRGPAMKGAVLAGPIPAFFTAMVTSDRANAT